MPAEEGPLRGLLVSHGVAGDVAERLATFGALLLAANIRTNLTAARSPEALLTHLLDSLSVAPYLDGPFADVGSGGGLPGIPAAIATGYPVLLVESAGKKAAFLRSALEALRVEGEVVEARAEIAGRDVRFREEYAAATARAVASLPTVLELTAPLLRLGGRAVLQRGVVEEDERRAADDAAVVLGLRPESEVCLDVRRRIMVYRKIAATSDRYPRRPGIPAKRPLCLRST